MNEQKPIPVFRPSYDQQEVDAVAEVLFSGWAGLGPKTKLFEEEFAQYVNVPHVVGMCSGTAALHLAMEMLKLAPDDEVIVTPITFVSTVHAVCYCGAKPVFADVEPDTLNIDPKDIARKITPQTKAIVPVHYGGQPCDMDAIHALADPLGIAVIEDAAHACGAKYKGRPIGSTSDLTCFSFHAVKNLAMGEGGAVSCKNQAHAKYLREMRWLGISKDTYTRTVDDKIYAWQYWVDKLGYKAHLSDVAAAIGLVQLKKLDKNNARRKAVTQRYDEAFKNASHVEPLVIRPFAESSHHLYVIKLPSLSQRDALIGHMKDNNISPGVHYYPIHMHPYYKGCGAQLPVAEKIWERIISLPIFPVLSPEDQDRVIQCVLKCP